MMGFNPTFYAGRPKLSEVTIDSDLNMGGRDISGVDVIRAGRVYSPIDTDEWPTETLDWGDSAPTETKILSAAGIGGTNNIITLAKPSGLPARVAYRVKCLTAPVGDKINDPDSWDRGPVLYINGVEAQAIPIALYVGEEFQFNAVNISASDVVTLGAKTGSQTQATIDVHRIDTGEVIGAKTFNLAGKWLAIGLNMQGLAATVKIQGVEMPYSDYAKYFPLAPTELKIPGDWTPEQVRPAIEVYK